MSAGQSRTHEASQWWLLVLAGVLFTVGAYSFSGKLAIEQMERQRNEQVLEEIKSTESPVSGSVGWFSWDSLCRTLCGDYAKNQLPETGAAVAPVSKRSGGSL